jgi:hypothetical protein
VTDVFVPLHFPTIQWDVHCQIQIHSWSSTYHLSIHKHYNQTIEV